MITFGVIFLITPTNAISKQGFAVIELFTSESCSSCPVADKFLIELTNQAKIEKKRIFALGFHVDYWNYLNWVDEYSNKKYSNRQREYATTIVGSSVYTPQIIINGKHQLSGYKKHLVKQLIEKELSNPKDSLFDIKAEIKNDSLALFIKLKNKMPSLVLNAALVETGLSNNVSSGENSGRKLTHANVVREFISKPITDSLKLTLPIPPELNRKKSSVIVYVHSKIHSEILDAQEKSLIQ